MSVIYFDECGEEGFNLEAERSSSEWFVVGAALQDNQALPLIRERYHEFRRKHGKQANWFFHFRNARHDERLGFIQHMTGAPYVLMSIAIHKPSLTKRENFRKRYFLYFYAMRLILERATQWAALTGNGPMGIMMSERRGLSPNNFRQYLHVIRNSPFVERDHMKWNQLALDYISCEPNRDFIGLQMADCLASSLGKAIEISQYGTLEPRYICELGPMLHRHLNHVVYAGVRIFPQGRISSDPRLYWRWEL